MCILLQVGKVKGMATTKSEEAAETPKVEQSAKRPELYMPRGDAKSFVYDGKKISVEKGDYVQEVNYINDTEIAVLCEISLHMMYFTVYNTEQEKFTFEAKGYDFIWRDEDLSTLIYAAGPYNTGGYYAIYNFQKKEIYSSKNWIYEMKFSGDDKLLVTEIEPEEEGEGKEIEKEIDI